MIGGPVAHGGRGHVGQHEIGLAAECFEDAVKRARLGHVELQDLHARQRVELGDIRGDHPALASGDFTRSAAI